MGAAIAYVVTLLPAPDRDAIRHLRFLLKIAKRRLNMRALTVREVSVRRRDARRRTVKLSSVEQGHHHMANLRKYDQSTNGSSWRTCMANRPCRSASGP
jgi:hypothetical protein